MKMVKVLTRKKMKNQQNQRKLKNLRKDHQNDIMKVTNHKSLTMKHQQRRAATMTDDRDEDQIDNHDEILQMMTFQREPHVAVQRNLKL